MLVSLAYNIILIYRNKKKQNHGPINLEILGDHSDWMLEDSPSFLTIEEVKLLRSDLTSMTVQHISNGIGMLLVIVNFNLLLYINC